MQDDIRLRIDGANAIKNHFTRDFQQIRIFKIDPLGNVLVQFGPGDEDEIVHERVQ